ncbi:MAG: hypothetical protein EBV68_02850 [Betaproteobacteria bacterium]|nr:hypothetical protein [Betaproteobacteria bacterium]
MKASLSTQYREIRASGTDAYNSVIVRRTGSDHTDQTAGAQTLSATRTSSSIFLRQPACYNCRLRNSVSHRERVIVQIK